MSLPHRAGDTNSSDANVIISDLQFIWLRSTGLSGLGAMLESYHKLQPKPKTVPEFKDALKLMWSALLEK